MSTKYKYHKDGTQPQNGEMFVFGSNLSGIHGAGAARAALKNYGAVWGVGFGPTGLENASGCSFAIPTKNWVIESMALDDIRVFVKQFVAYTYVSSKLEYFVTRVGCGLAGWKDSDIAPMFKGCNTNCNFPEEWKEFLE